MAVNPNTMIRSSSGTLYFDALLHADHTSSVTPTQHPVQTGAAISDHAYVEPKEISLEVGMTDVVGGDGSSVQAYKVFLALMEKREPCTVVTRLATYSNMLLTSISSPDDYTTMYGLRCTLIFTEIRVVSVAVVQVQQTTSGSKQPTAATASTPATTASTTTAKTTSTQSTAKTAKSTATTKQSVLKQATDAAMKSVSPTKASTTPTPSVKVVSVTPNAVAKVAALTAAKTATTVSTSKATVTPVKATAAKAAICTLAPPKAAMSIALLR